MQNDIPQNIALFAADSAYTVNSSEGMVSPALDTRGLYQNCQFSEEVGRFSIKKNEDRFEDNDESHLISSL